MSMFFGGSLEWKMTSTRRELFADSALITSLWMLSTLIVNPVGDFPLNDDFSYGLTVKHLIETGDYRPHPWFWAPFITNALWGALFSLAGGFSFTALRLSTLLMGVLGVIGGYVLVRELDGRRWFALLSALALGFNPLYYALSHTFMTDVAFTALGIWATVFFARCLRNGETSQFLLGTAFALLATLSRQLGLCIPLAFVIVSLVTQGRTLRTVLRNAFPLILCVGAFLGFRWWLAESGRRPALVDPKIEELLGTLGSVHNLITFLPSNLFVILMYLGLFLFPVLLVSAKSPYIAGTKPLAAVLSLVLLASGVAHVVSAGTPSYDRLLMPVGYNVFTKSGVGPVLLRDVTFLNLDHFPALPTTFWMIITIVTVIGALLLIWRISRDFSSIAYRLRRDVSIGGSGAASVFVLLSGLLYIAPLLLASATYDEYLIPLVAFLATGAVGLSGVEAQGAAHRVKYSRFVAFAFIGVIGLFSIGITRDYLMWNRIRWEALERLQQKFHVNADDIDGGFEFNALYRYDPDHRLDCDARERSCWWVLRDTYQIAFGAVPGYKVIEKYTYQHWLPPHVQKVVVLRKEKE